jgi:hypothetical protein
VRSSRNRKGLAATGGDEEGDDVVRTAGRPRADSQARREGVEGRDGRAGFLFGLHREDLGAVGDEVPRPYVRSFDAGDRRLGERLRRRSRKRRRRPIYG